MQYEVLALGSNGSGQLGIGHYDDVSIPNQCCFESLESRHNSTTSSLQSKPVHFAAGGNHTLILFEDNLLFASGLNDNGRHGSNTDARSVDSSSTSFKLVDAREKGTPELHGRFKLCSATWEASTFVTVGDVVLSSGTGLKGELGQGEDVTSSETPRVIESFCPPQERIVDLAACMGHTVAVLSNGEVYGWGSGRKGQLGEPSVNVWSPRKIEGIPFRATRAACGKDFTYIAGPPNSGEHMVLGPDKWKIQSSAPAQVKNWLQISASWGGIHVHVEGSRGSHILSWGRNDHGQHANIELPAIAPPSAKQPTLCAGSEHVIAEAENGTIVVWGWGEHGNCGTPTDQRGDVVGAYNVISDKPGTSILGAGCATSFLVRRVS